MIGRERASPVGTGRKFLWMPPIKNVLMKRVPFWQNAKKRADPSE